MQVDSSVLGGLPTTVQLLSVESATGAGGKQVGVVAANEFRIDECLLLQGLLSCSCSRSESSSGKERGGQDLVSAAMISETLFTSANRDITSGSKLKDVRPILAMVHDDELLRRIIPSLVNTLGDNDSCI